MSWSCPYQDKDYFCKRLKKTCKPGIKGCILKDRVKFLKIDEEILKNAGQSSH